MTAEESERYQSLESSTPELSNNMQQQSTSTNNTKTNTVLEYPITKVKIADLKKDPSNPNRMTLEQLNGLELSFLKFGNLVPVIINQNNEIVDGQHRAEVYEALGITEIPAFIYNSENDAERRQLRQVMNKLRGQHDSILDAQELEILKDADQLTELSRLIAMDENIFRRLISDFHPDAGSVLSPSLISSGNKGNAGSLALRWGIPPFSVLDRRTQTWQTRRRQWLDFGIASEQGRENVDLFPTHLNVATAPLHKDGTVDRNYLPTVSVFDPVLAEIMIRWFSIPDSKCRIFDPFSGGSVRGIVASVLGHEYVGIDLREEQIAANERQYTAMKDRMPDNHIKPQWIAGDSKETNKILSSQSQQQQEKFDLVLTSPPYFRIEHYSDLEQDLNNMTWNGFCEAYREIIHQTADIMKDNRFICWNVGNARDPKTKMFVNQQDKTKEYFAEKGFYLQNELVLIHPIYSLIFRTNLMFQGKRTIPKQHEYVLVFYNGTHDSIPKIDGRVVDIPTSEESEIEVRATAEEADNDNEVVIVE
jgi:DNA modification methylase